MVALTDAKASVALIMACNHMQADLPRSGINSANLRR